MIILSKENFKRIMELGLMYEEAVSYNKECFSVRDVLREVEASDNVDKLLSLLIKAGVDIEQEFKDLSKLTGINFFNGANFVKKEEDFNIKYKLSSFESFVEKYNPEFIVEDEPIVSKNDFNVSLEINNTRFAYENWEASEESISYLKDYCDVFRDCYEAIENKLKGCKIKEIHCIRDTIFNDDVNLSQYVVCLESEKNTEKPIVYVQLNRLNDDALVFDCKSSAIKKAIQSSDETLEEANDELLNKRALKLLSKIKTCKEVLAS